MIIKNLRLFSSQLGWRLWILFLLLLLAGAAEGFGISLILPLLQTDISAEDDALSKMIKGFFNFFDLPTSTSNVLMMLVIFFFVRAALLMGQTWYMAVILSDHLTQMRSGLIRDTLNAKYLHLMTYNVGYLTNGIVNEIQAVNAGVRNLLDLVVALVMVVIYVALPTLMQPILSVFLVALAIPLGGLTVVLIRKTQILAILFTDQHGSQEGFLIEGIRNAKFVKSTGRTSVITDRLIRETMRVSTTFRKLFIIGGITRYGPEPLIVLVMAGMIIIYTEIYDQPIVQILFLMFLFFQAAKNMIKLQSTLRQFTEATGSLKLYQRLREDLAANAEPDDSWAVSPNMRGAIEMRNVGVTYPKALKSALSGVNLTIPNRKTVALVGASGSGKTTIANLVCGLIPPSFGEILIAGVSYKELRVSEIQAMTGYVTQENAVFNATFVENVTFWESDPDRDRVADLMRQLELSGVGVGESDVDLLDRRIGGDGAQLSGGERQRLSIARELYRNSELMILDEATSALDSELEKKIDQLLESQQGNKTFLIIAHRLSTVRSADLIYVLGEGKVIESGSFDELIEKDGEFARMVKLQSF
jgi:ABC-type multidrug transport system fused ATPase/permease subunit